MKKIAIWGLLALAMGAAHAEGYVGLGVGGSAISGCDDGFSCKNTSKGMRVYAGVMLGDSTAIELGQIGFGHGSEKNATTGETNFNIKVNATVLNLAWRPEIQQDLRGVLRLGLASSALNVVSADGTPFISKTSGNLYFGFGAEYALTKHISGVLAADFAYAGDGVSNHSVRMLSLGLQAGF
jgi:hypothetical protein